jgi:S-DNA-T family DNA segregation ATPase FtsK/SpoIIIE
MELLLSVGFPELGGWQRVDVSAELDAFTPVATLVEALASWGRQHGLGVPGHPALLALGSDGARRRVPMDLSVFYAKLVSGHEVHLVEHASLHRLSAGIWNGPEAAADATAAIALDVASGPDTGQALVFSPGRHMVGRSPDAAFVLSDPAISAHHFVLEVSDDLTATINPNPHASNGTFIGLDTVTGPRVLRPEETVLAGNSQFVLRPAPYQTIGQRDRLGQVSFNPLPYKRPLVRERAFEPVPAPPERRGKGRFPVTAVLLPLAAAGAMVWATKNYAFVALVALSPMMMLSNHFSEGKSSKANHARESEEFRTRTEERAREVSEALRAERSERLVAAPDLPFLARQAAGRLSRLWERPRGSADFLQLRAGLGTLAPRVTAPVAAGGDPDLQQEAKTALAHQASLPLAPVTLPLDEAGIAGIWGPAGEVQRLATALVLQAALLHSPEQLVIAAAVPTGETGQWSWLKWLPHTRSATSPLEGPHLVDEDGVDDLVRRLAKVVSDRAATGLQGPRGEAGRAGTWPRVLVVMRETVAANRALLSSLLDPAPAAGIAVLWVGDARSELPRQCRVVLALSDPLVAASHMQFMDPEEPGQDFVPEGVGLQVAERTSRWLAPLRDVSAATLTTGIPRIVELFDLPDLSPRPATLLETWAAKPPYGLGAPLGTGADGTFEVDLVHDGPHALIAGTSGAGKSELLQTLVLSMAARYSPRRLNFLFIDYKGGAASAAFEPLPHTVGSVTNLDERLALRALASLRAELRRRMAVLEGRAKDLAEMLEVAPDEAPPSLVIVVDEFATLVKEVPEFMAGMVDVAQRGRSLGIHLVLATQRPTGAVNDNILANTNLRIALRVLDPADSVAVIGSREAAGIPVPLRGRAFARLGPGALEPFQCAWSGAPFLSAERELPVLLHPFAFTSGASTPAKPAPPGPVASLQGLFPEGQLPAALPPGAQIPDRPPTQLEVLVQAAAGAARLMGLPAPRRPWVEPLPEQVGLAELLGSDPDGEALRRHDPGRHVVLGLADLPDEQRRVVVDVDLEGDGGLLVIGSGGAGKTTLLRTIAAGLCRQGGPDQVRIFVLDFGGRSLLQLEELPQVVAAANADELEKVTRLLTVLQDEIDVRRRLLAEARADSLSALRDSGGALAGTPEVPRLVLLLDGYAAFHSTFEPGHLYHWVERLARLVTEGRQVGVHAVITNNRPLGIPAALVSAIAARVTMRMATTDELMAAGVPRQAAVGTELGAGRCFLNGSTEMQAATASDSPGGAAQADELGRLATELTAAGTPQAPRLLELPDVATLPAHGPASPHRTGHQAELRFALGLADITLGTAWVDISHQNFVVLGPALSGRSGTLCRALAALRETTPEIAIAGFGAIGSPLAGSPALDIAGFGRAARTNALEEAAGLVAGAEGGDVRLVLLIDQVEDLASPEYSFQLDSLLGSDVVRVVAACDPSTLGQAYSGWTAQLRRNRAVLVLQPESWEDVQEHARVRPNLRPGQAFPPGRGVLADHGRATLVQVAYPFGEPATAGPPPGGGDRAGGGDQAGGGDRADNAGHAVPDERYPALS